MHLEAVWSADLWSAAVVDSTPRVRTFQRRRRPKPLRAASPTVPGTFANGFEMHRFEEEWREAKMDRKTRAGRECDVFPSNGASGLVYAAAALPVTAWRRGAVVAG